MTFECKEDELQKKEISTDRRESEDNIPPLFRVQTLEEMNKTLSEYRKRRKEIYKELE